MALVAAYAFNENAGTTTEDFSATSNDAGGSGMLWQAAGKNGSCARFTGAGADLVTAPANAALDTADFTVSCWVYITANSNWQSIVTKEVDSEGYPGWTFYTQGDVGAGIAELYIYGSAEGKAVADTAITINTWTHLAATYDGSNIRLYINGSETANTAHNGGTQNPNRGSGALEIGGNSLWGENFTGYLDDVRIYDNAQTPAEILADSLNDVEPGSSGVTVTAETGSFGITSDEPVVSHVPAAQTTTPETASFALASAEPVVSHVPSAVTATADTASFSLSSDEPVVSQVAASAGVNSETGSFGLNSSEPAVSHVPAAVTVTPAATANLALSSTEPAVTHVTAAVTVSPDTTATFGLSSTAPVVSHIDNITLTASNVAFGMTADAVVMLRLDADSCAFGMTAPATTVTNVAVAGVVVSADDGAFGLNSSEPVVSHVPAPASVTCESASFSINSAEPLVTHIPVGVIGVYADDAAFGISATEPVVSHVPVAVTVSAQDSTFNTSAAQPAVTSVPASGTVAPSTATFGWQATVPVVSHVPAPASVSAEAATLGLVSTQPVVSSITPPDPGSITPDKRRYTTVAEPRTYRVAG